MPLTRADGNPKLGMRNPVGKMPFTGRRPAGRLPPDIFDSGVLRERPNDKPRPK